MSRMMERIPVILPSPSETGATVNWIDMVCRSRVSAGTFSNSLAWWVDFPVFSIAK